jgi:NADPH2:quinone reductase
VVAAWPRGLWEPWRHRDTDVSPLIERHVPATVGMSTPEYAIRLHVAGGPDILRLEEIDLPAPGPGEVRLRQTAIGVNFIDALHRSGRYPAELPTGLGSSAAGIVEAVGPVTGRRRGPAFAVGDRVAYASVPFGAYATARNVPVDALVALPPEVSADDAAAVLTKGLIVWALLRRVYPVRDGDTVVFHAAAGGVGLIAGQWLTHLGARAIGTVGSLEKVRPAIDNGYGEIVLYRDGDLARRARDLTDGVGVPVVYDSVGAATFENSLDCLRPRGLMVSFGSASGAVTGVDLSLLATKGSLYLTRPTLSTYLPDTTTLRAASAELFGLVVDGVIRPNLRQRFDLADAGKALETLESRATVGATVLVP